MLILPYLVIWLSGYLQPIATLATYHAKDDFNEFSLPAMSSCLKASTGIEVKTGQLNTALDLTLTGEELGGNIMVLLQALETGLVVSEEDTRVTICAISTPADIGLKRSLN